MIPPSYIGQAGFSESNRTRRWNNRTGWATRRVFTGPRGQAESYMAFLAGLSNCTDVNHLGVRGALADVEGIFPDAQDGSVTPSTLPNVSWNMPRIEQGKDIFDAPAHLALDELDLARLRSTWKAYNDGPQTDATYAAALVALVAYEAASGLLNEELQNLFKLRVKKVESYSLQRFMLQRVALIPYGWAFWAADLNVGKVYDSTVDLLAAEDVLTNCPYVLPSGMWLKHAPDKQQQADGRIRFVQDFEHATTIDPTLYVRI